MKSSVALVLAATLALASGALLADPTFRLAALEYSGATSYSNSDQKMQVLYDGMNTALTAQENAGTPVDMLVTAETPSWVGSEDGFDNMAQEIPGARTANLAAIARTHHTWVVAGLLEKAWQGSTRQLYNSAVVFDRDGNLVAKYRKVNLPPQESSRGILPGGGSMVVDTEFGPMGLLVCWEAQFPAYVAGLMAKGPLFVTTPSWGNFPTELASIAGAYGVPIASSCWDGPSRIVAAGGAMLDEKLYTGWSPSAMKLAVANVLEPVGHPGDANRNGRVNVDDLGVLASHYDAQSGASWWRGDFTADGRVNVDDLGILASNYDWVGPGGASVPEPATLGLLALGGLALIRKRRR